MPEVGYGGPGDGPGALDLGVAVELFRALRHCPHLAELEVPGPGSVKPASQALLDECFLIEVHTATVLYSYSPGRQHVSGR